MCRSHLSSYVFFFNDTATTEIYTLSLHDALPIYHLRDQVEGDDDQRAGGGQDADLRLVQAEGGHVGEGELAEVPQPLRDQDRKSTRLNSSHANISYAVFCLKKKKMSTHLTRRY